jgi:nucleoside-diphosphate-sugar epimerase
MKKILITGATGFIGSYLVEEALRRGYIVFAGVRESSNRSFLKGKDVRFFVMDLSSQEKLEKQFSDFNKQNEKFDFIIHNAGITKAKNKKDFLTVNYNFTRNFVNALINSFCVPGKFIYISSLAAFGPKEDSSPITDSDRPMPITFYGRSKLHTEKFIGSLNNFPHLIIRPSAVYGPRDRDFLVVAKMINRGLEPYLGKSNQMLSFIFVRDLANMIFEAIESPISNRAYFMSDGYSYTTETFNNYLKKHLNKKTIRFVVPKTFIEPLAFSIEKVSAMLGIVSTFNRERSKEFQAANWSCDIAKMKKDLNFTMEHNLDSGLLETIHWYRNEGWL